ncbi:MAG: ABC transporter ATP-binding protein [Promethearchaeota archaeon]
MLVECKDVIKIYPSPIEGLNFPALRGLHLTIQKGELVAIIGPSGAGKTTLFRLMSGFDVPSSGEIWFDGRLTNNFTYPEQLAYRQKVGVMYQSPTDNLLWGLSALKNVLFPIHYSGKFMGKQKERAHELLERVGLQGKEYRRPSELSGGEQQRVAIAVALANNPQLLLADEPTGELDSHTTSVIIDYFKELNSEMGTTIAVATHDRRFSHMTPKTYKIQDGRITTYQYTPQELEDLGVRREAIIVDAQGNLRLPPEILEKFKGLGAVEIIEKDGKVEIVPVKPAKKDRAKEEEADE